MIRTANSLHSLAKLVLLFGLQIVTVQCFSEIRIIQEPEDFTGFMQRFRSLSYTVAGDDNKYEWYHNGTIIPEQSLSGERQYLGERDTMLLVFDPKPKQQGIYQLKITSKWGRIFGREIKVLYTIVGKFHDKEAQTYDVVIGEPYRLPCPRHSFTRNAVYKWGGNDVTQGTWFYPSGDNNMVLDDGTLFFSYVTKKDIERIKHKDGVRCMLDGIYQQDTRLEPSGAFFLRATSTNKTVFGPKLEKIPNKEVQAGKYVIFRCIAAGYPAPTYKWEKIDKQGKKRILFDQVNGIKLSDSNKLLTIEKVREDHAGTYVCTATADVNGTTKTVQEQNKLKVRAGPSWVKGRDIKSANPNIFSQHVWTCIAKGDPEPEYHWYANTTIMMNQSGRHTIEGGILTFHRLTLEDTGMYQCVAKNKYGFIYQTVAMVVKYQSPVITKLDDQTTLIVGTNAIIRCESEAVPKAEHSWLYNGVKIKTNSSTMKYGLDMNKDLVIRNVSKKDAGTYTCVATNTFGKAEKTSTISIGEIVFNVRPQSQSNVKKGDTFSLNCDASSNPPLKISYKWKFQNKSLTADTRYLIAGTRQNKLLVLESKYSDSGVYECIAYTDHPVHVEKEAKAQVIVRGIPDPPENLTLQNNCSNFEANLSWIIPYQSPYDPLKNLQLQWSMSSDRNTWYNVSQKIDSSSQSFIVSGLNPWSQLNFRLFAVNKFGRSQPSEATDEKECTTPGAKPTKCPDNVKGTATKPKVLEITWQDVSVKYRNGPSFKYIVSYRQPGSTWEKETVFPGPTPRYVITEGGIDQLWEFKVQSNNALGTGPDCGVVTARSEKQAPSVAPQSFVYEKIGPTFVVLKWQSLHIANNIILGYKITYWQSESSTTIRRRQALPNLCEDETNPCEVTIPGANTTRHRLENLQPYQVYTLELRAYNNGGSGPKSSQLTLKTAQDKPGAPHHVKTTPYGKYIMVNWQPPRHPNGAITGYIVTIEGDKIKEPRENLTSQTNHLFENLVPKQQYKVYVQAKTSVGPGDKIVKMVNTTSVRVPAMSKAPDVYGVSKDSVNVTLNEGNGEGGFSEKFYVMYKEKGQDDKDLKRTNTTWINRDGEKSYLVVNGLDNEKKYLFATVIMNSEKQSGMSEFTEGQAIQVQSEKQSAQFYTMYWFYIIIAVILLLILVLLLILFLRRKPKQVYKVSERERKHATKNDDDDYPLNPYEPDHEEPPQGKTYGPILTQQPIEEEPIKATEAPGTKTSPPKTPDRDSLDDYDGEDDDFSEHGSFIGQYGSGVRASQSSLSNFV